MVRLSDHWSMWSRVTRGPVTDPARSLLADLRHPAVAGIVGPRGRAEALQRSSDDTRSDLSPAATRQAGIEHRCDAGLNHLQNVDRRRRTAVPQVRDLVIGILP